MKEIKLNKKNIFNFLQNEFLKKNITKEKICRELSINIGTINRWIQKKEVPEKYFNLLNRILDFKFSLIGIKKYDFYKLNDMFYTDKKEAKLLIQKTFKFIVDNWNLDFNDYCFIDPSAGNGVFLNLLNVKNKIGIDLNSEFKNIIKKDYLNFFPKTKKNIVIGNPPFGLRGNLALRFINHSTEFADFICFILPPFFNSNGKGSPLKRINENFYLAKEFKVENNIFKYPNGKEVIVNSIFQIWTKIFSKNIKPILPPKKISEWIKVYSLSNGNTPSTKRNVKMLYKCDFYLPSTTFRDIKVFNNFKELPHNRGYGVVFLKNKEKLIEKVKKINWMNFSFKSTNGANNLRTQIIIDIIELNIQKWMKN